MKKLSILLFSLLIVSTFAFVLPNAATPVHAAAPNWKPFYSCLNAKATCLDISGPLTFWNGLPNANATSHHIFLNVGIPFWYNSQGSNMTVPLLTAKWGSLSFARIPNSVSHANNASTFWYTYGFNYNGNTATITVYYKQQISSGYVSQDLKQTIVYSFSSYPVTLKEFFLNPLNLAKSVTSTRLLFGTAGYDWKDSPTAVFDSATNSLSWTLLSDGVIDPVTIGTATNSIGLSTDYGNLTCYTQSYYIAVYPDGTNLVYRTSTDGTTWSSATTITAEGGADGRGTAFACTSAGEVAYAAASCCGATAFKWREGSFSGGTITWNIAEQTTTPTNAVGVLVTSIDLVSTSEIWFGIDSRDATPDQHVEAMKCASACNSGTPTVSSKKDVNVGATENGVILRSLGTNNEAMIYGQNAAAGSGTVKVTTTSDGGTTWSTAVATSGSYYILYGSAVASGTTAYVATGSSSTGGDAYFFSCTYPCSSWSAETLEKSSVKAVSLGVDSSGNVLIGYISGTTTIGYLTCTGGSSTCTDNTLTSSETSVFVSSLQITPNANSETFGLMWEAGSVSPFNIRYAAQAATFTVTEKVTITMSPAGSTSQTVTITGCSPSQSTITADGTEYTFTATFSCSITYTAPAATSIARWGFSNAGAFSLTWSYTTAASGTDTKSNTLYANDIMTLQYSVSGGGTPTAPTLSITALGAASTVTAPSVAPLTIYPDRSTSYSLTNPTTGSTSSEQWKTNAASGTTSAGGAISPTYYHQYLVTNPNSLSLASPTQYGSAGATSTGDTFVDSSGTFTCSCTYSKSWTVSAASWIYEEASQKFQIFSNVVLSGIQYANNPNRLIYTGTSTTEVTVYIATALQGSIGSISQFYSNGVVNSGYTWTASTGLFVSGSVSCTTNCEIDFGTAAAPSGGTGGGGGGYLPPPVQALGEAFGNQTSRYIPPAVGNIDLLTLVELLTVGVLTFIFVAGAIARSRGPKTRSPAVKTTKVKLPSPKLKAPRFIRVQSLKVRSPSKRGKGLP